MARKESLLGIEVQARPYVRPYEAVVLMHPDTTEDDQKALFKKNKGIIEDMFKGNVNHLDTWGKRNLANPINKNSRAFYFHTTFTAEPEAIAELERTMRINDNVLRFVHTRLDDRVNLAQYLEDFKKSLAEAAARERERESKFQARRAARSGGPREFVRKDDARRMTEEESGPDDSGQSE